MRLGTLGGPGTFAAQAAQRFCQERGWLLGDIGYFPTLSAVWQALDDGSADRIVLGGETQQTGFVTSHIPRILAPDNPIYVLGECVIPYDCCLLARPDTTLAVVDRVLGHGSLTQCGRWLEENLPDAAIVRHPGSSFDAAKDVARGDKGMAVVSTRETAALTGLEVLANGIDDGAEGSWWMFSKEFNPPPVWTSLVIGGTFDPAANIVEAINHFDRAGWVLRSIYTAPSTLKLFEFHALMVLSAEESNESPSSIDKTWSSNRCQIVGCF